MLRKIDYSKYNETIYYLELNNGLRIYFMEDNNFDCMYAYMNVKLGSFDIKHEDFNIVNGAAHFLEHMIFKLEDGTDALQMFSSQGAKVNAMTSYRDTVYLFECHEDFYKNMNLFLNMLDELHVTEEAVEKEKDIIVEEINMFDSDVDTKIYERLNNNLYHNHPIKIDIGGRVEDVKLITANHLKMVYDAYYGNSNRFLVICGPLDATELIEYFIEYDQKKSTSVQIPKRISVYEPKEVVKINDTMYTDITIPMHLISFKIDSLNKTIKEEYVYSLMLGMLLGSSSKSIDDLRNNGLLSSNFHFYVSKEGDAFSITISNTTQKIDEYENALLEILFGTSTKFFDNSKWVRTKKAFLGEFIFGLNQVRNKVDLYTAFKADDFDLFEMVDLVNSISLDEIICAYNDLRECPKSILKVYKKTE